MCHICFYSRKPSFFQLGLVRFRWVDTLTLDLQDLENYDFQYQLSHQHFLTDFVVLNSLRFSDNIFTQISTSAMPLTQDNFFGINPTPDLAIPFSKCDGTQKKSRYRCLFLVPIFSGTGSSTFLYHFFRFLYFFQYEIYPVSIPVLFSVTNFTSSGNTSKTENSRDSDPTTYTMKYTWIHIIYHEIYIDTYAMKYHSNPGVPFIFKRKIIQYIQTKYNPTQDHGIAWYHAIPLHLQSLSPDIISEYVVKHTPEVLLKRKQSKKSFSSSAKTKVLTRLTFRFVTLNVKWKPLYACKTDISCSDSDRSTSWNI